MGEVVNYERLKPSQLRQRVERAPIAYLPLGTLEWHGEHMPLGADGLQSGGFFELLAQRVGGVVLPMLFMGVDSKTVQNGDELYGMDICGDNMTGNMRYESEKLYGSCYWQEKSLFDDYVLSIAKQLARMNFKILVAHGHGPSINAFRALGEEIRKRYSLLCFDCWNDEENYLNGLQVDHGGENETSIMMHIDSSLVDMSLLPDDRSIFPKAIGMIDPRGNASPDKGKEIVEYQLNRMTKLLNTTLEKI